MLGDGEVVRTRGHQGHRGLAMQEAPGGGRHVPVDRVMHELVPEHDSLVGLVEQLGVERIAQSGHYLGRCKTRNGRDIPE
jgi:hypothetical protein